MVKFDADIIDEVLFRVIRGDTSKEIAEQIPGKSESWIKTLRLQPAFIERRKQAAAIFRGSAPFIPHKEITTDED